jgi:hypothetical protein
LRYDAKDYMRDHTHGEPEETEKTIRNAIKVHDHFYTTVSQIIQRALNFATREGALDQDTSA